MSKNISDIKDIDKFLIKLQRNIEEEVFDAVEDTTFKLHNDVKNRIEIPYSRNPSQFEAYKDSIDYDVDVKRGIDVEITGKVFSDLLVGGDDPKWKDVPVGAFLEWGTGPMGESSNEYPHGYDYTRHVWDYFSQAQYEQTGTFGITARPHFLPALNAIKSEFEENVKEAVERAWMKSEQ